MCVVKVKYDIYTPPVVDKLVLLNARLYYDTSVSPIQLKKWYEPNFKIGVKFNMDGQIYLDEETTRGLFNSAIPTPPTTGAYVLSTALPLKNSIILVWLGKTTNNYDTPAIVVINKQIMCMLIYNPSTNSVQVNHHSDVYANYETNGQYNNGVVTLSQGQYVLFYNAIKPTVNSQAPWGFTNYEPKSSTTKPTAYVDVTDHTNHYYYINPLDINLILDYGIGAILTEINNYVLSYQGIWFKMATRGGRYAHMIDSAPFGGGLAIEWILRPQNIFQLPIYDTDPPSGLSWAEGHVIDNVSYIKDSEGVTIVVRTVKHTTTPYNPRYTQLVAYKYVNLGDAVKMRIYGAYKTLTDIRAYGSTNVVCNPGPSLDSYTDPASFEYFNGSNWVTATPGSDSYNYYSGYGIRATIFNPLNPSESYKVVIMYRKQKRYGTPPVKVASLRFTQYTSRGILAIFQDYAGGTIPAGNYVCMCSDAVISTGQYYNITTEAPTEDTDVWSYLYGYPYDISVSAPSSATPGSTVTVTVSTNAPDGTNVYVVDKDTDEILGSGTVSGGQATIQFTMPNKNLSIRVYVEGTDITLG